MMINYQKSKVPPKVVDGMAVHPLVRWIWKEMNRQRVSQEDVAKRSGVSSSAMRKWRTGVRSPKVVDLEAVINVLGGKIKVTVKDADEA